MLAAAAVPSKDSATAKYIDAFFTNINWDSVAKRAWSSDCLW
jgi:hypothetical protein